MANLAPKIVKGKLAAETEDQQKMRFQVELEFVQCLANPNYLHFIAQRGYFKDSTFLNYLKYLQYWKEPEYARYIKYPNCLHYLDLLQYEHFRREIANSQCCKYVDDQMILSWQQNLRRGQRLLMNGAQQADGGASTSSNATNGVDQEEEGAVGGVMETENSVNGDEEGPLS